MNATPSSKEVVVLKLLEEGDTMLCLDARYAGVQVPKGHSQNPNLRLILNLDFPHPIEVTAAGISANLGFGGRRFACYVPMEALWAAFNPQTMQGMMWPDSIPPEVLSELAAQRHGGEEASPPDSSEQPARPRVIPGKGEKTTDEDNQPSKRQRGHLRVIK